MCSSSLIVILLTMFFANQINSVEELEFCSVEFPESECRTTKSYFSRLERYILYDINPQEGFNLRRDVYMRMAVFAANLPKNENWHLVLPPWPKLYHWRSTDVGKQSQLPWGHFFDISSLQKFAPVVEMYDFLKDYGTVIDQVYVLQHYKDAFQKNYKWEEKFDVEPCQKKIPFRQEENGLFSGNFWGYNNLTSRQVDCLSFHGVASQLATVAANFTSVMFDHAEVALHDFFGDGNYWQARRSMRFSENLRRIAEEYRKLYLNSTDENDGTVLPQDWTQEKAHRNATGGPYLCAHLRRRDFLWGRPKDVPNIMWTAEQIKDDLERLELDSVFLATDAPPEEIEELRKVLADYRVFNYKPPDGVRLTHKDGGVAIIEQIICSHARYFIGTHESTFSFRIQEEREIMGFPIKTTFNRFCGDDNTTCKQPTQWKIVY